MTNTTGAQMRIVTPTYTNAGNCRALDGEVLRYWWAIPLAIGNLRRSVLVDERMHLPKVSRHQRVARSVVGRLGLAAHNRHALTPGDRGASE